MGIARFDVHRVNLDPSVGTEIRRSRPCLVISPDEMNRHIRTVIVAPMTTKGRSYPTRVACRFRGKHGQVVYRLREDFGAEPAQLRACFADYCERFGVRVEVL